MAEKVEETKESSYEKPKKTETWSGIPLKEVYGPEDVKDIEYQREIGDPGEYPYTRGLFREMFRYRSPTSRIICGFGSASDTNERWKFNIAQGHTGLDVYPDIPTQLYVEPWHPRVEGEVGVVGPSISSLRDYEDLLEGIPFDKVRINWRMGIYTIAALTILSERLGIDLAALRGNIQNGYAVTAIVYPVPEGRNPLNLDLRRKLAVDIVEHCTRYMPSFYCTYIDGYNIREFGLSAPQELAIIYTTGKQYLDRLVERGLKIDDFGPRISFFMTSHRDFFEEVAKFRAIRRMWAKLMKERYGAKNPRSLQYRFAVETAGSTLTPEQPLNNIVRIAYECMSAVLGGVQAMSPPSYLEPVSLPTEESAMIQARTQQILFLETGVTNVSDPLGGSYYIEWLTNKIEEETRKLIKEIEDLGGLVEAEKKGWVDRMVEKVIIQRYRELESGERVYVGKNCYTIEEKETPGGYFKNPSHDFEASRGKEIVEKHKRLLETRDNKKVKEALHNLWKTTKASKEDVRISIIPAVIEAEKAYASLAEMQGTIRHAWGLKYDVFDEVESPFKFE